MRDAQYFFTFACTETLLGYNKFARVGSLTNVSLTPSI